MERFNRLFGSLLAFVYHCFDRVVINGYWVGLSRLEQLKLLRGSRKLLILKGRFGIPNAVLYQAGPRPEMQNTLFR